MLFNSSEFILAFLPIVVVGFYVLGKMGHRIALTWLVTSSLFFYGWWNPSYLALILTSIVFNYAVGSILSRPSQQNTKAILILGVAGNLAAIGYFKYTNFAVNNINAFTGFDYNLDTIILPLAISFFTFQQITYLVDTYRGDVRERNFLQYCLFVTFFPQLIAGPIVHHKEMLPQFAAKFVYKVNLDNIGTGVSIFCLGLFKKVVLADGLALYATPVFTAAEQGITITLFEAWAGALAYTFQLYFDFSGYSDMAIGIARMFNIKLPLNFHSPYKATNIIDFWRRWHMTLSRFLRDYLYIPLGGNRKGKARRYGNLMLTMLLGGLWHGAGWTFVIWGFLHGIYLVINHLWHRVRNAPGNHSQESGVFGHIAGWALTFLVVVIAWVVFRAESMTGAKQVLAGMAGLNGVLLPTQVVSIMPGIGEFIDATGSMALLGGGTIMGIVEMLGFFALSFLLIFSPASQDMSSRLRLIALVASIYFTVQAAFFSTTPSEFLYFQF